MRLYYTTSLRVAQEHIIPEGRLKLSTFDAVNDPFELLAAHQGDPLQRRILKALREHWTKRLGMICFSAHWSSPLMWAHYAQNHTGVCLGIDVIEEHKVRAVVYEDDRLQGLFDASKPLGGANHETLMRVLTTKYKQWAYEDERRVFVSRHDRDPATGHYYVDFGPTLILREVILGVRCQTPVGRLAKLVKSSGKVLKPVTVFKTRPAFQTFTMVRQKRISALTVLPLRTQGHAAA